jgi:hypothetical protein
MVPGSRMTPLGHGSWIDDDPSGPLSRQLATGYYIRRNYIRNLIRRNLIRRNLIRRNLIRSFFARPCAFREGGNLRDASGTPGGEAGPHHAGARGAARSFRLQKKEVRP